MERVYERAGKRTKHATSILYSGRLNWLICTTVHSNVARTPYPIRYASRIETRRSNSPSTLMHRNMDGAPWKHKSQCMNWSSTIAISDMNLWISYPNDSRRENCVGWQNEKGCMRWSPHRLHWLAKTPIVLYLYTDHNNLIYRLHPLAVV